MKYCNKCKLAIDTDKERYIKIEDNEGKKNLTKLWYHKKCWSEIINTKNQANELSKTAKEFMNLAKKRMNVDEEVYI